MSHLIQLGQSWAGQSWAANKWMAFTLRAALLHGLHVLPFVKG